MNNFAYPNLVKTLSMDNEELEIAELQNKLVTQR